MKAILTQFMKKLEKEEIPCFVYLALDKNDKPKFIEVIVKRPYRYTRPKLIKKVPKTWNGIKVKAV